IKACIRNGYQDMAMTLNVITVRAQSVFPDEITAPFAATFPGYCLSLSRELPLWKVSCIDLDDAALNGEAPTLLQQLLHTGKQPGEPVWMAFREGRGFVQQLLPLTLPVTGQPAFRKGGVYLIAGGAGGIGSELGKYLAMNFQATIVFLGRRAYHEDLAKYDRLIAGYSGRFKYIQTDISDADAVAAAVQQVKTAYGVIHGVVHAAIVLRDSTIANMEAASLQEVLAPKVRGSVVLTEALKNETLDFYLFCSSAQSFSGNAGQSNYCAASTFEDAWARYAATVYGLPVRILNWGYWGDVGIVATDNYRERLAAQGIGAISTEEGMAAIAICLQQQITQVIPLKIREQVHAALGIQSHRKVFVQPVRMPSVIQPLTGRLEAVPVDFSALQRIITGFTQLHQYAAAWLLAAFHKMGALHTSQEKYGPASLKEQLHIIPAYNRLWEALLDILYANGYISITDNQVTVLPAAATASLPEAVQIAAFMDEYPQLSAHTTLLRSSLDVYNEILTGRVRATDLLFPAGSPALLEKIYQGNPVVDYCNELVATAVKGYIEEQAARGNARPVRILEIGAGTGSTTGKVLHALNDSPHAWEYCFTDISARFVQLGRQQFGSWPQVDFNVLDIERPVTEQDYVAGSYDVIIAANVLHATVNMTATLREVKHLLAPCGVLVLNEVMAVQPFTTYIFGLLDGWWRFEDASCRIKNGPLLSPALWKLQLGLAGFRHAHIAGYHNGKDYTLGQLVLIAESDGLLSMHVSQENTVNTPVLVTAPAPAITVPATTIGTDMTALVTGIVAEALEMKGRALNQDQPFAELGVDSITGVAVIAAINKKLGLKLGTNVLFDYTSIKELANYIRQLQPVPVAVQQPLIPSEEKRAPAGSLSDIVYACVQETLETTMDIDRQQPFSAYGIDSILGVRLINLLNKRTGLKLQTSVLFDYVNIAELSGHIHSLCPVVPVIKEEKPVLVSNDKPRAVHTGSPYKAVVVHGPGSIADVTIAQLVLPDPQEEEVQIAVKAFSLNFGDLLCVKGLYPTMPPFPFTPGFEIAGIVKKTGAKVTGFKPGDPVIALMGEGLGAQAELANVWEGSVIAKPENVSYEEACSLPIVYLTMEHAFRLAAIRPGEKILIQTAAGGTGLIAVQMALGAGAEIFATAGSADKLQYLQRAGVHHLINYQEEDFSERVKEITGGKGVDVVINTLSGDAIQKGLDLLTPGGRYIEIAMTGLRSSGRLNLSRMTDNQVFYSLDLRKLLLREPLYAQRYLQEMVSALQQGAIKPVVGKIFEFDQLLSAYDYMENRANIGKIVVRTSAAEVPAPPPEVPARQAVGDIAIIGMSGRFPGADDLNMYWQNLAAGKSAIREVPAERWDIDAYYSANPKDLDKTHCRKGGFLDNIDLFDPVFFNISGKEALFADPQQRLFLEQAWNALEDAGYANDHIANARCCIYIGGGSGDYLTKIAADGWLKEAQSFWGNDASITAARLAYHLNLKGAAVALNTACSSSLVAIHLACRSIQQGESDMAVAGGVFVTTTPDFYVINSNAEMLSPDGICRAFDNNANGYVPGEGVAAIILKPLAKALADGDQIYAVIKGSGINQDGKTNGITAPGTKSQTALETEVYQRYHIHPDTIGMVECHGTGTRLGDPIEMEALTNAFRAFTDKKGYCAVGSVKTAIGHAVAAAGIASVIKAVLSLRHQQIPPTLHFETPNEQIPFAESPFYVITKLKDWAATNLSPRRAAVSSFGFSGTNAHMVLEEAPARTKVRSQSLPPAFLVALSAKTAAALQQKAADLLTWLQQPDQRQLLTDIAYTLHTGRMHFKYRLALIVTNTADLITQLQQWTNGENGQVLTGENGVVSETGQARGAALIEEYALGRHYPTGFTAALRELAALYVGGGQFDWEPFYKHMGAGRISLPLYPFERRSYWLAAKPVAAATPATPHKEAPARPLIDGYHTTASPQEEGVLFHKVLTANDEVAGEHIVQGNMVMPAVAHIEMAVEAFTMLYNLKEYELHDLLWLHPVVVETTLDVTVLLKQVDKDIHFEISSTEAGTRRVHSRGRFVPAITVSRLPQLDMADIRKELKSESVELPYLLLGDYGIQYGPFFEGLIRVWEGKYTTLGMIALPGKHADDVSKYVIHPGITDAAAQAIIAVEEGLYRKEKNSSLLPFALKRLVYQAPLPANAYAYVKCGATAGSYDVCITDVEGNVCVYMEEMNFRELIQPFVPLYYQPIWKEVPAASPVTGLPGNVLLVHNGTAVTEGWRQHIARHYSNSRIQQVLIPLKDKGDNGGEYTQLVKAALPATDIYFLAGEAGREGLFGLFHLVKTLIAEHISVDRLSVWIADNEAPYEAALTGFVCSMKQELPSWKVLTVQVPADMNREEATRIIQDPGDEIMPVVAFRGGRRYVKRICDAVIPEENTSLLRVGGTYVITGGAGGIGYHLSLYLARTFRAKLLWAGRSPLTDEILAKMRVIEMLRGEVHYAQVNISEEAAGHVLLEAAMQRFGSINGVIHAAAVLCDKRIAQMTAEDMQTVLLPKEQGSLQLWKAFEKASPDFFAFFSSIQSFAGNAGQANYGAANAFMDAFALQLQATATFPVKVINWGYWGGVGLSKDAWLGKQLLSKGLLPLTIQEGVTAFEQVLSAAAPQYIVMKATAELLRQSGIESNTATSASTEQTNNPPTLKITAMPEKYENPSSLVKNAIIAALADVLRLDREIFDDNTPYMNYGIDSLMAVDIVNKVSDELKINLRVTDLFNYANISKLAEYITQHFPETVAPAIVPPPVTAPVSTATREVTPEAPVKVQPPEEQYPVKDTDIAIIGKAGQFPGAPDAATFWQKLAEGYNGVKEITRWPAEVLENSQTRHGGLLDNIDVFDPLFFNISPKEAELMDTQQRLFLQTVWHALEDAAYSDREMDGRSCCVYVGCEAGDYNGVLQESADRHHGYTFTGTASSILAARISYFLNLQGASVPVDTACSSSLVAIHLACEALRSSQTEMAIAGGVTVMHTPLYFILASNAGMLSPDGKCKTFDDSANGFVPAEAIGAVVLKRLKDALRDGDNIQAVITASGINQDGKTNGITAPSAPSQIALLRSVYQQYGIHPEDISCIEAHGTGTKLGDPIEVEALTTAYNYYTRKKQYCAIGSVKTNIGHAGTAAGVAGLFKLILSLQHRQLAPSLHCHQVNRLIEFDKGPFYVNTRLQDWHTEKGKQRTAAISSFGFSGTNAHLVLQEAPATAALPGNQPPAQLLVLSAKTPEALQQRVVQLAAWLQEQPETLSLTDVAFVAGAGRSHFLHRVAIVATSRQQLVRQLGALLQQQPVADTWTNNPALNGAAKQPTRDLVRRVTASRGEPGVYLRELALLAEAYVAGSEVDFGLLYEGLPVKKISIPVYPFAKERYYPVREERPETIGGGHLHPLIHTNISDFSGQQFSSTFSGKEIFLNDHVVNDRKTMPGAALLEMALQAGKTAAGKFPVTISKVGWLQPLLSPTGEVVTALDVTGDWAADVQIAHADGERLYMEGKLGWNAAPLSLSDPDISTIRKRCQIQAEHHALYDTFSRIGLQYGPAFRTIQRLYA
ncbi:MAG TPA: SDR family NAD(P)-dependent oxidoreductase, partial [Chitinophaga sp.]|uniref:SDR family NAD(P)-dependent oxidoreductase n=1 Tax=Chitinophaga sp. TaxID=1869181 RepID=UPI002C4DC576